MQVTSSARLAALTLTLAGLAAAPSSQAATSSGTLTVSALVLQTCVVAATPMAFPDYALVAVDATATITVTCAGVPSYTVGLNQGTGSGSTTSARKATSGANTLNYGLYSNVGRTTNWGNTTGAGADVVPSTAAVTDSGAVKTFTVFGNIPAGQTVAPGAYADTVQIDVVY